MKSSIRMSGRFKVSVLKADGTERVIHDDKNLIFNQGFDKMASMLICDTFLHCAAGVGTLENYTDVSNADRYTIAEDTGVMTRTSGSTNFTSGDIGRIIAVNPNAGGAITLTARIVSYTSATVVTVSPAPTQNGGLTNQKITREYLATQTKLNQELNRTSTLSTAPGDNGTTQPGAFYERNNTRSFIFPVPTKNTERDASTYTSTAGTVTRSSGTRAFDATDVGAVIYFVAANVKGTITAYTSATQVTIDYVTNVAAAQEIILIKNNVGLISGNYSATTSLGVTTVTKDTGTRNFRSTDVGKKIYFTTSDEEATITEFTDASNVKVGTNLGSLAAQPIQLHGFVDISEVGCSDEATDDGENINMRTKLSTTARIECGTPITPAEQLKVSYTLYTRVHPSSTTAINASTLIAGSGGLTFGGSPNTICETYSLSQIDSAGATLSNEAMQEPSVAGSLALSTDTSALITNMAGKSRTANIVSKTLTPAAYTNGTRLRLYSAEFGVSEAVRADGWKSITLHNATTGMSAFTVFYTNSQGQTKDSSHRLGITFKKSWDIDI